MFQPGCSAIMGTMILVWLAARMQHGQRRESVQGKGVNVVFHMQRDTLGHGWLRSMAGYHGTRVRKQIMHAVEARYTQTQDVLHVLRLDALWSSLMICLM